MGYSSPKPSGGVAEGRGRLVGERTPFRSPASLQRKAKDTEMLLGKTRKAITDTVSQPAKNSMVFSLVALALSIVALFLGVIAVSR